MSPDPGEADIFVTYGILGDTGVERTDVDAVVCAADKDAGFFEFRVSAMGSWQMVITTSVTGEGAPIEAEFEVTPPDTSDLMNQDSYW